MISINIYRYNPETDKFPYMQTFEFEKPKRDIMVLELLNQSSPVIVKDPKDTTSLYILMPMRI